MRHVLAFCCPEELEAIERHLTRFRSLLIMQSKVFGTASVFCFENRSIRDHKLKQDPEIKFPTRRYFYAGNKVSLEVNLFSAGRV